MNNSEYRNLINPDTYTGQVFQNEGASGLLRYLNEPQSYRVMTVAADWGIVKKSDFLLGKLGHHALILLAGNRTCEWTPNKTDVANAQVTQNAHRMVATGRQIEKIWQTHLELSPKYHRTGELFDKNGEGYLSYMPFKNDCFTYVDRVLVASNEPPIQFSRTANSIMDFAKNFSFFK